MALEPPKFPVLKGFLGLVGDGGKKVRRPLLRGKDGNELSLRELLEKVAEIAQKKIIEAEPHPPTMVLIVDLFNEVLDMWFDADLALWFMLSPKKRWILLGALSTAFVLGKFMGANGIEVEEIEQEVEGLQGEVFPLHRLDG